MTLMVCAMELEINTNLKKCLIFAILKIIQQSCFVKYMQIFIGCLMNSLRPRDAYMRQLN